MLVCGAGGVRDHKQTEGARPMDGANRAIAASWELTCFVVEGIVTVVRY